MQESDEERDGEQGQTVVTKHRRSSQLMDHFQNLQVTGKNLRAGSFISLEGDCVLDAPTDLNTPLLSTVMSTTDQSCCTPAHVHAAGEDQAKSQKDLLEKLNAEQFSREAEAEQEAKQA